MKKLVSTIVTTSAAAAGLLFAGVLNANADSTYTVKSGDSVWAIAQKFNTTINHVETTNNIKGHYILPGQKLSIKTSSTSSDNNTSSTTSNTTSSTDSTTSSYTGSNLKSYVLSQMQSRTGVSASTWNTIITRESNWQPYVRNSSSGAYGLFQNMHISSGSVEEQVNAAVALYEAQGMAAWAL
ncbi:MULTISPECIES: LysM peptidoglycan-binding domain-containing protein [Lactiplantibacillus]|uniref:LysM peptidoglycan-binding domain-containing protein n=1 Tax=Lactiplantibacillus TaxID=2767842 RepID=UPI0009B2D689|nr:MULTISPECIES: LysM peptidoglycan-binding domain-containing protein [Lactiplantibacillus]ASD31542.1 peptidoglycan-binding protein [Lactiplantibacillus plantarum]AVW00007.1 LysM peptidoglycan-binding domain-containing protein [Lactiplantibacillus plantarum]AVW08589.1 LysM peptidoglycan-binding domain-containing protein [Lactiplantibacillus plantarum]AXI13601.1 LysM peptidoglycan-binding domain-containing protein [Lactiplantibacillus plantarum]MBP5808454.1 LysM peptidoglycan-binding domain-con